MTYLNLYNNKFYYKFFNMFYVFVERNALASLPFH